MLVGLIPSEGDRSIVRDLRTDNRIRAREVRVLGPNGEQLGVLPIDAARSRAQAEGLNLVEINPMTKPPVCKIMDYGKFKYEEKKKANEAKKKQFVIEIKEIKLRPKTEDHDYDFKVRHARQFIEEGDKVKVTLMFRGREITHRDLGQKLLEEVVKDLKEVAVVEQVPRLEGRQMFMILAPNPKVAQKARDARKNALLEQEREKEKERQAREGAKPSRPAAAAAGAAAPPPASRPASDPQTPAASGS